jgi:hypothetical protein
MKQLNPGADLDSTCIGETMRDPRDGSRPRKKTDQKIDNKPTWFARVEKMVYGQLDNPIASFGAALYADACQQKSADRNTRITVSDLLTV